MYLSWISMRIKIRKGRGGGGEKNKWMRKRLVRMSDWISFKISYGSRESKNLWVPKSKQDLRNFLWVTSPKALLVSVAEAWYHRCRELWAPIHLCPFPRSLWCPGSAWERKEAQQASASKREFESRPMGLLPSAKIQQFITKQPQFIC